MGYEYSVKHDTGNLSINSKKASGMGGKAPEVLSTGSWDCDTSPIKKECAVITDEVKKKSYSILTEFINSINNQDIETLKLKFSVNENIFKEIKENLQDYFGEQYSIEIAPFQVAFEKNKKNRPNIDIYEMNEPNVFGLECIIWLNKKPQEPVLHVEVFGGVQNLNLRYKYIGS